MNTQFCPNCGFRLADPKPTGKLRRLASAYGSYRQHRMTVYQSTAITPWQPPVSATGSNEPGFTEAERRLPVRPQNAESDFLVPLLQAMGTGSFVTLAALVFAYYYRGFTWGMACAAGILTAGLFWLIVVFANRSLLWTSERIVNEIAYDDDSHNPPPSRQTITLEVNHKGNGRHTGRSDLPGEITEAEFLEFPRGVILENRGLAEETWTGAGKPFSKPKYAELLDILTKEGIIRWRNPNAHPQGRELTEEGRATLLAYVQNARTHAHAATGGADYDFIEGVR